MTISLSNIRDAIDFISADPSGDSTAFVSLATGNIIYHSCYMDDEDVEALPDDIADTSKYCKLPDVKDLNLGIGLVYGFINHYRPSAREEIRAMFKKRGAYAKFSNWLERHNLTDNWHRFREETSNNVVAEWCVVNGIQLS
ncbi:MAG: UPF0158 family protein [Methylococcales bacterium]|nr:UPF0158 family protein [Methylococcales bacterium]